MVLAASRSRSVFFLKCNILCSPRTPCLLFSTDDSVLAEQRKPQSKPQQRKSQKEPPCSWEERLADVVTPLWRLSYEEQLEHKQNHQLRILSQLSRHQSQSFSPARGKLSFPVLSILPSPVRDGYRNKSTFSVNRGVDGNPKTVGFYVGTGRQGNIVCVNGDHLLNMPEKHKQVARCYQDFIRQSSLEPCLQFHTGGHWREVTVRTNTEGRTMAIVYFHPQSLTQEEVAVHKADLVGHFTQGPGSVCQLDSLFFQESSMTRCTHEESPYQLLHGQPHIYEEVLGFKFRISADAFFQVNQAAAEVLYGTVRDLCVPNTEEGRERRKVGANLLDVCCGTGAIGITISSRVDKVIGIELIEQAVEDARHNAAFNNVLNCEFIPGKAEVVLPGLMSQLSSTGGGLTAVVNPARAGLHPRVVRALRNQPSIRRLVYVSCKPHGEAMRNFRELCCEPDMQKKLTGDAFSPTLAVPVDMFPHTPHCELVLLFER
ncbi:tRNA (uracil(54)-C(5))-methyltransferase homolog-B isoform X1 [Hippoglossus hippoglossus]|uniref:tRNA (uracil(54)-C(5))-methyltransferase homolog-B isoform X1 n=1 Tax=Hippoglossus hippoglossus TaxID=8267 RepID=UPI00148E6BE2|nr:tRNA (uracil(54)-C(5))-methyltransferase homolog-B isoform X1 [Hippoglossus hippoglossus]